MNSLFINEVPEVKSVATANNEFSVRFLQVLRESQRSNVVYSPFSLSAGLGILKYGSGGTTAEEMTKCLRYPFDEDFLIKGYESVMDSYRIQEDMQEVSTKSVTRLYVSKCLSLQGSFVQVVKNSFFADVEAVDFSQCEGVTADINSFVEQQTKGKIREIVNPDALRPSSKLVLVNTVYFKALWLCPFRRDCTKKRAFHISNSETVDVPMMHQNGKSHFFNYGEIRDLDSHAVSLPYQSLEGSRFCMILIVPKTITGLGKVEKGLLRYSPELILTKLTGKAREVHLSLPRFKTSCVVPLVPALKQLGFQEMFHETEADFSRISTEGESLNVSNIIQKTFLEVNEEGTEVAAEASIEYVERCCWQPLSIFTLVVDRPFFFMIFDKFTGFILFAGRCVNPLEEDVKISRDQLGTSRNHCCTV